MCWICLDMGSRNLKNTKDRDYLYYVIAENGKKGTHYCGLASKPESEKKALELELLELREQGRQITKKMEVIKSKISKIKS